MPAGRVKSMRTSHGSSVASISSLIGTPLVADPFHADRWDYVYRFSQRGTLKEERHITVVFEDDKLARIEGDVVPAETKKEGAAASDVKNEGAAPATAGGKEGSAASAAPKEGSAGAANAATGTDGPAAGAPRSDIGKQ